MKFVIFVASVTLMLSIHAKSYCCVRKEDSDMANGYEVDGAKCKLVKSNSDAKQYCTGAPSSNGRCEFNAFAGNPYDCEGVYLYPASGVKTFCCVPNKDRRGSKGIIKDASKCEYVTTRSEDASFCHIGRGSVGQACAYNFHSENMYKCV